MRLHLSIIATAIVIGIFSFAANAQTSASAPATGNSAPINIVGFGDSLMAGYQLDQADGFTAQLQAALQAKDYSVVVHDAGVSGDTTSAGLARLDWSVPDDTQLVILELGANDALRGISPELTEKNLDQMLARLQQRGIAVLLAGMLAPPNMGEDYAAKFNPIYQNLAEKYQVPLYPFFLEGVTGNTSLQLADGMHPNREGVEKIVTGILPLLQTMLDQESFGLN